MPDADSASLEQIYDALVQGYTNTPIPGTKWKLTAAHKPDNIDDVSDDKLPFLLFDIGTLALTQWKVFEQYTTWNVSATLKVKGEPGDVDKIFLRVIQALMLRTYEILGLPVDDKGNVVPFNQATATLFDQDKLTFLAERGAPVITAIQTQPSDGKYLKATVQFGVQCVLNLDPRNPPIAKVAIMEVASIPGGPITGDTTLPASVGIPTFSSSDDHAVTLGYDTASPTSLGPGQGIAGTPPSQQLRSLVINTGTATPYALSLSAGTPTGQLAAIATFMNWQSNYVTQVATWSSSNTAVATVDANGLVTRVAAGSCTVSCSIYGATSNAVAVTCS